MLVVLLFYLASSTKVLERTEAILSKSSKNDNKNEFTCKRPSVKAMALLWDTYPDQCIVHDSRNYVSIKSDRFQFERGTEVRLEFVRIWNYFIKNKQFYDSWMGSSGIGLNDKGGTQEMLYNNIDSAYLMGEADQLNTTFQIIEHNSLSIEGDFNTYDFITKHIGSILSAYYLTNNIILKEKAIEYGERIFDMYRGGIPYTTYNFKTKKGDFGKIPIKQLINVGELYILHRLTKDERYENLIKKIIKNLKDLPNFEVLPQHAYIDQGKTIKYADWLTSSSESAEVSRILWNNWKLSNKQETIFKTLFDINKKAVLTLLPFTGKSGDVIMIQRTPKGAEIKMNLKMCAWAGVLAEVNKNSFNSSEMVLAQKLMKTCLNVFEGLTPSDYLYLEDEKVVTKDSLFSLPGEIAESLFFLFRTTGEHWVRKAGMHMFRVIKKNYAKEFGYVLKQDEPMPGDLMSKTLKYLFLLQISHTHFLGAQFNPAGHLLGSK